MTRKKSSRSSVVPCNGERLGVGATAFESVPAGMLKEAARSEIDRGPSRGDSASAKYADVSDEDGFPLFI